MTDPQQTSGSVVKSAPSFFSMDREAFAVFTARYVAVHPAKYAMGALCGS